MNHAVLLIILLIVFKPPQYGLSSYFSSPERMRQVKLSKNLREISALSTGPDGRLYANDDEKAIIYQLDIRSGEIIKSFKVGDKKVEKGDFEGLAVAGSLFYLITSKGDIYEFQEGGNDETVPFRKFKTWLKADQDVEGLCYDPETNALLVACKGDPGKDYKNKKAIYSFSLEKMKLDKDPRFVLDIDDIVADERDEFLEKLGDFFLLTSVKTFAPSGIERHPVTGHFIILSAIGKRIIELSAEGQFLHKEKLDFDRHQQPEGITFLQDLSLLISDEGTDQRATLTTYSAAGN
jgi:uncharacterized protein YjiK